MHIRNIKLYFIAAVFCSNYPDISRMHLRGAHSVKGNTCMGAKGLNIVFNGEIVVALVDDSATVKTFYREKDRIRLQPENDSMEPIYVKDALILGKVTALIRSMS